MKPYHIPGTHEVVQMLFFLAYIFVPLFLRGQFYLYNILAMKAVDAMLPLIWPEKEVYLKLCQNATLGKALAEFKYIFMRILNPIFDITLINNTSVTQVLHTIEIVIEDVSSVVLGFSTMGQILRSIHTYQLKVDFNRNTNSFLIDPQISFGSEQPARFKIQFKDFMKYKGGNMALIHFNFLCNNKTAKSESLSLHSC